MHFPSQRDFALACLSLTLILTAACSDSDSQGSGTDTTRRVDTGDLCLALACGRKETLLRIPDAENMIFTHDGRLFVSGSGLWEVVEDGQGGFESITIERGVFRGGLAIIGDVLYVNDPIGRRLLAARIAPAEQMDLRTIHNYLNIDYANGLQAGRGRELYVADGPFLPVPVNASLVRIVIDPDDPFRVLEEQPFLSFVQANIPDGLALRGDTLYFTDTRALPLKTGVVRAVEIQNDGSAGEIRDVFTAPVGGLFDEVNVIGDHLFFTDFNLGQVIITDLGGNLRLRSAPLAFEAPSAALVGRPPMFSDDEILVTEKGVPIEGALPFGNALTVFRRSR